MKKVIIFIFLLFFYSFTFTQNQIFKLPEQITDSDYISKSIIFKVKPEYKQLCLQKNINIAKLNSAIESIGGVMLHKKFPNHQPPAEKYNKYGEELVDLSLIYEITYTYNLNIEDAINILLTTDILEYAEPHYLPHLLYVPNDPFADTNNVNFVQWHLKKISAYEAWDIQQGDTDVVIGMTDTGIDLFHIDLDSSIKYNYNDPINGIDDDSDGYIDNFYGWDLGNDDNDPQWEITGHGVFVSGMSSATVDNLTGCAGVGFKSKFLPVKISDSTGVLNSAYDGIVYAADHGCRVINCSWGCIGGGQFEQNIINYATNNKNALVVAACGNAGNTYPYYPAAYNFVLSVCATDTLDIKWNQSSYGTTVDIAAPGENVYSTWTNGSYMHTSGTSFAASIVSGAAAIAIKNFPSYSPLQIAQQLISTTDNIDTIPSNAPYAGLMGTGRLNMFKMLTITNIPSVTILSKTINDNNDNIFVGDDTLFISCTFKNYLAPSSSFLKATISTNCPYVEIIDSSISLGIIPSLGTVTNSSNPFKVRLLPNIPLNTQIDFKVTYEDTPLNYESFEYFSIIVNTDYLTIDTNKIALTITSKGKIGYNGNFYQQGTGFTYNSGETLMECGGFLAGNSATNVDDNIYGDSPGGYDYDWIALQNAHYITSQIGANEAAEGIFNDSLAGINKLDLTVKHRAFAWDSFPNDKFIVLEYTLINQGLVTQSNLYAGIYIDWDISNDGGYSDRVNFDDNNKMGYCYPAQGGTYTAIKLLDCNGETVHHYAFDNDGSSNGSSLSINISDGFTGYEKYNALKTASNRDLAGVNPNGNDVSDMISTGPFVLQPGDSAVFAFALIAGDSLIDIQSSAVAANDAYCQASGLTEYNFNDKNLFLSEIYPNPSHEYAEFFIYNPYESFVNIEIINSQGQFIKKICNKEMNPGINKFEINTSTLTPGMYQIILNTENHSMAKKFIKE